MNLLKKKKKKKPIKQLEQVVNFAQIRASNDSLRFDRLPLALNCQKSHDIQATNKENLAGKADLIPILYNCIVIRVPIPEESEGERERERERMARTKRL